MAIAPGSNPLTAGAGDRAATSGVAADLSRLERAPLSVANDPERTL